jgi:hypothetical protein
LGGHLAQRRYTDKGHVSELRGTFPPQVAVPTFGHLVISYAI